MRAPHWGALLSDQNQLATAVLWVTLNIFGPQQKDCLINKEYSQWEMRPKRYNTIMFSLAGFTHRPPVKCQQNYCCIKLPNLPKKSHGDMPHNFQKWGVGLSHFFIFQLFLTRHCPRNKENWWPAFQFWPTDKCFWKLEIGKRRNVFQEYALSKSWHCQTWFDPHPPILAHCWIRLQKVHKCKLQKSLTSA